MASAQANARRTMVGAVVIGIHVILALGLIAGTAIRKAPQIAEFIDTRLIEAEDEPPPKEPPPPPPDFVPPPVAPPPMLDIPVVMGPPSESAIVIPKQEAPRPAAPPPPQAPPPVTQARIAPGVNLANLCPYPSASRRLSEAGSVVILFYVTANGRATEAKVESSSGFPRLDDAAVNCLRKGRYVASTVGGQAVDSWQRIRWTWKLED
jgi:periplasmic protein TonB